MAYRNSLHYSLLFALTAFFFAALAVGSDAQSGLFAWGDNRYGQLGIGTFDAAAPFGKAVPTAVVGLPDIAGLADGFYHSVAFATDGTVWTWGYNYYGELGLGVFDTGAPYGRSSPTQVPNLTGIVAVAAGTHHSVALKSDGTVWAWGWNVFGQAGDGSGVNQNAPVKVARLTKVIAIAAGGNHSLALESDGSVWAWGGNIYGELGDGTTTTRQAPTRVAGGAAGIACGQYHSMTLQSDGTVYAWGSNSNGQLGNGTTTDKTTSVRAGTLANAAFIAAGAFTSLAILSDGSVWAWGWNAYGQIGDGTITDRAAPTAVKNLTGAVAIASGQAHCLALKSDGSVWAWGWNAYGQAGSGVFATSAPFGIAQPQKVGGIAGATAIAGGGNRAHAIFSAALTVSVSGAVTLDGLTPPYAPYTLNFLFRPVGGGAGFLRAAAIGPDGGFTLSGIAARNYNLWIKGPKWLARVVSADASGGATGLSAELSAGDTNNDNRVDVLDFGNLVNAYSSLQSDPNSGYDPNCDFNEDGAVDVLDFGLLVNNYGTYGAN